MNNDFLFWNFLIWFSAILLWGWTLTVRNKRIRVWIGVFSIVVNFVFGIIMMPVFFRLSKTMQVKTNADSIDFQGFLFSILSLLLFFAPMFIMGILLRKNSRFFDALQGNNVVSSLENDNGPSSTR